MTGAASLPRVGGARRHAGLAVLTCAHAGQIFEVGMTTPAPYTLSGRRADAQATGYVLTVAPDSRAPLALHVSAAVWAGVLPLLSGEGGRA
ncbi:hypothetical protein HNQ07_000419 [Deinococcus metalli]|uniref:Uncharacterized protein n=1 Tax=Deinococcus metalli TaxID=1141878 RepID=A0A7W8NNR5_9DEIO|nr:hypothetical protein [Deinococcus metalli]MBB5374975.1 hypothetical protein [Deinococcus metalli]GHF32349.1 hypothetical protein GCM10017781_06240 [Deinococcus metalli]